MNKQARIDSDGEDYPQIVVTQLKWLCGEYQIEQGDSGEVDLHDSENDVISISRDQAIKLAKQILEFEGELV